MGDFRAVLAIVIFCVSGYLVFDLIANGFSWIVLGAAISGFIIVHFLWPSKRTDDSAWYDALEFIFDLPYRVIAVSIRGLGKMFKNTDGDIGIDL